MAFACLTQTVEGPFGPVPHRWNFMGLDQLTVLIVGTFVPKEGGHTLSLITLVTIPPWSRKPRLPVASPKVITLGHIPCNR